MSYVPLWVKSNYSFLEAASHPDELVEQAAAFQLPGTALTDRDGVYGIVKAHTAAVDSGRKLIVGSELTVHFSADYTARVLLLATSREGYATLCGLISTGRMANPKGESSVRADQLPDASDLIALWPGAVQRRGLLYGEQTAAERLAVEQLSERFAGSFYLVDSRHGEPGDRARTVRFERLGKRLGVPIVAATEVRYHSPERRRLFDVMTCIRHGTTLYAAGTLLSPTAGHTLLDRETFSALYTDAPDRVLRTLEIAERCEFSLAQIDYRYPTERVPHGYTTGEWLWELTFAGARTRYGGTIPADVRSQLQRELEVIDDLEYAGYFLTMWEIVEYCRRKGILAQGRGSAANSSVCYCLGITAVDPVRMDLLFERFLSRERAEPPDIDLDIEHRRREEVIQYMYEKYGRERAAMVANVIRYRVKSAIRDIGKVLEFPLTALDRMAKLASSRDSNLDEVLDSSGVNERVKSLFSDLVGELLDAPRHLSIHPGGFLLGSEPVHRLVPVENATMPDRTVIQWDKYDVEAMNLFKIDLLGLGALTHLDYCFRLLNQHRAVDLSMATIPHDDPAVFRMIRKGDTLGVFQLESRAQMAMLPRLQPRIWYDIVIEVSIVRPGPITGGMVHPYLRRRTGEEDVAYPHPALEPVLKKTLGIPIFQEQVMKLAVVAADYSPGEADQLRRDMAAWRHSGRIEKHHERLVGRMVSKGIEEVFAEAVFQQIRGFGEYGFPESHAASFALIAYGTAWMRAHYPAEFTCGLLNAWPMGFYSPASIVEDAKRHGTQVRSVDVLASDWDCTLEPVESASHRSGFRTKRSPALPPPGSSETAGDSQTFAVRMGLRFLRGISEAEYRRIVRARRGFSPASNAPTTAFARFCDRARLPEDLLVSLARAGAFESLGLSRRQALWEVSGTTLRRQAAGERRPEQRVDTQELPDASTHGGRSLEYVSASSSGSHHDERCSYELLAVSEELPDFDPLSDFELVAWDYHSSSHSVAAHPLEPHRLALAEAGHPSAQEIWETEDGSRLSYVGLVITRQRPSTAGGTMFITLEDETGFVNLVVWKRVFEEYRPVLLTATLLGVEGRIQAKDGVVHLVVDHCFKPQLSLQGFRIESRNFR